jgi:hypothetical protein
MEVQWKGLRIGAGRRTKGEGRKAKGEIYIYQRMGKRNPKTKEQKVKMHPVVSWIRKSTFQTISDIISIPGPSLKKAEYKKYEFFSLDMDCNMYVQYMGL